MNCNQLLVNLLYHIADFPSSGCILEVLWISVYNIFLCLIPTNSSRVTHQLCLVFLIQALNSILNVINQLLEKSATELLGLTQVQKASSSRILQVLDDFVRVVDSIYVNETNKTLDFRELKVELPNFPFSINRDLFIRDVFFVAIRKKGIVSVSITTNNRLAEITSL